jgi:hypothetical protein
MLKIFTSFEKFITFCAMKTLPITHFFIFANSAFLEWLVNYNFFLNTIQHFYTYPHTCDKVGYFNHTAGVRSLFGTSIHLPHYSYMNIGIFWSCGPENAVHINSGIDRFLVSRASDHNGCLQNTLWTLKIKQLFVIFPYILLSILKLLSAES